MLKLPRIGGIQNEMGAMNNYYKRDKIRMAKNFRRELEKAEELGVDNILQNDEDL